MQCSKGSSTIAPIIPSGDYVPQPGVSDSIYFDSSDGIRDAHSDSHPQVTPVMDVKLLNEMNDELASRIGRDMLPQDQLILLHVKPLSISETNPPTIRFAFVTPPDTISPDDISVILDGENISGYVKYSLASRNNRKADFFLGSYKPSGFMNPIIQHSLDISITPQLGNSLSKHVNFNVPQPGGFRISRIGFPMDNDTKEIYFNRLRVTIYSEDDVAYNKSVLDKTSWTVTNKSEKNLPEFTSVEPDGKDAFILNFSKNFESFSKLDISFSPADGITTENYEVLAPYISKERGGDVYRKGAADCPPGCEGSLSPEWIEREVEGCEDNHTWIIHADCPDPITECYSQIRDQQTTVLYQFNNSSEYYLTKANSCEVGVVTPITQTDVGYYECDFAHVNLNRHVDSSKDVWADYVIMGYNYGAPETCGEISNHSIVNITSDVTCPTIDSALFRPDDDTAPDCTTQCCEMVKYQLVIKATDDKCFDDPNTQLIVFYNDGSHRYVNPHFISEEMTNENKSMKQIFEFDSPNVFACATKLKVIVHDKKGNWSSVELGPQTEDYIETNKMPYPHTLELSFGERPNPNPENANDQRQYVNLERNFETEIDPIVCVRKIDHPDHGPQIYTEVTVIPPIFGVTVLVEYEDPEFRTGGNYSPTNKVDDPFDIDTTKFTPTYNGSMTLEEFKLLWGKHPPYPFWEKDGRTLGDNYNFFYTTTNQMNHPGIPDWDPIKYFPHNPDIPCFEKPDCTGMPDIYNCTDYYCSEGQIFLHTTISGKFAVYLNSKKHGGDNFKIKASTSNSSYGLDLHDCLTASSDKVFTNWREITIDFAWMEPRNEPNQNCNDGYVDYPDGRDYKVNLNKTIWIDGAYDDAFIEIVKGRELGPNPYNVYIPNGNYSTLHDYADNATTFHEPDYDTMELLGCDHTLEPCASGTQGESVPLQEPPNKHWHSFVFVGNIYDCLNNRPPISQRYYRFYIDHEYRTNFSYILGVVATHELLHLFLNCDNGMHVEVPYGVECPGMDQRSYLHHIHIIGLRHGVQGLYYDTGYQRCYNTAGITYFDLAFDGF